MKIPAALLLATFLTGLASGQKSIADPKPLTPPIDFQILQTSKINLGDRSAVYNHVAPPLLPVTPAAEPPPPALPPTAEQMQALRNQPPPKKNVAFFVSATVYDHQIAQLNWSDENGVHAAFSNLDFNYFCGVACVETADTSYFLILSVVNSAREAAGKSNIQLPALAQFNRTSSQYLLAKNGSESPTEQSVKALDDLHTYFDANKQQMLDSYNKRVANEAARVQWLKDHPPVPQNTVINFWRVNNANDQTAPKGGGR